jgi:hypothetical protein
MAHETLGQYMHRLQQREQRKHIPAVLTLTVSVLAIAVGVLAYSVADRSFQWDTSNQMQKLSDQKQRLAEREIFKPVKPKPLPTNSDPFYPRG